MTSEAKHVSLPCDDTPNSIYVINRSQQHTEKIDGKELRITEFIVSKSDNPPARFDILYVYRTHGKVHTWIDYYIDIHDKIICVNIASHDIYMYVYIPLETIIQAKGSKLKVLSSWFNKNLTIKHHATHKLFITIAPKSAESIIMNMPNDIDHPYNKKLETFDILTTRYDAWISDIANLCELHMKYFNEIRSTPKLTITKSQLITSYLTMTMKGLQYTILDDSIAISTAELKLDDDNICSQLKLEYGENGIESMRKQLFDISR